jgi:hypothetical protein
LADSYVKKAPVKHADGVQRGRKNHDRLESTITSGIDVCSSEPVADKG